MKKQSNTIRLDNCYFCNKNLYYRGHSKHREEKEIIIRNPFKRNDNIQKFYVHLKCWKAGLALIKSDVADGIFAGLDNNEQEETKNYSLTPKIENYEEEGR